MPQLQNTSEGGTNTTAITNANSGGISGTAWDATVGTAPTFSSTQHAHGGLAIAPTTAAQSLVQWAAAMGTVTEAWARIYFWITAAASANIPIAIFRDQTNANNACYVRVNTGATTLTLTADGGTTFTAFTTSMPTSTWVRIELHALLSGGNCTIDGRYYATAESPTTTETKTQTTANAATGFGAVRFGINSAQTSQAYLDEIAVSTRDYLGPVQNPGRPHILAGGAHFARPVARFPMAGAR